MADCTTRGVLEAAMAEYEARMEAEGIADGVEEVHGAKYMRNGQGALIPLESILPQKVLMDQTARRLVAKAKAYSRMVQGFRQEFLGDINAFLELLHHRYRASAGGEKGNVCLTSHDQCFKVEKTIGEFIDFGPELDAAKVLVDECLRDWSQGANANLRTVVERAFQTDKKGKIRREQLLQLLTYQIEDARWQSAMEALTDSINVVGTKEYVRFYWRTSARAKWQAIPIDIASDVGEAA